MNKQSNLFELSKPGRLILIILLSFCLLTPILSAINKSPTIDEARHFYTGLKYLSNVSVLKLIKLLSISPPLEALNTLPALFIGQLLKINPLESVFSFYKLIFWARILTAFYSLLLGFYVFRWARELYGEKAGLFALSLYAFCPNIIAHAGLITTDLSLTCFSFIWLYYCWKTFNNYSIRNIIFSCLFFTLGLLSKYNFVMFLPIYIVLCFLLWLNSPSDEKQRISIRIVCYSAFIFSFGLFVLCASYRFNFLSLDKFSRFMPILSKSALAKNFFLPFPYEYLKELYINLSLSRYGFYKFIVCKSFLMGHFSMIGFWNYYLVAFLIKNPVPMLIFLIWALYSRVRNKLQRVKDQEYFLWIPVLFIFLTASFQRCLLGIRHILPAYPFIFVFTSRIVSEQYLKKRSLQTGLSILIIWLIISTTWIFPHYLAYFNELIGGPDKGYNYLIDSNIDWGQDIEGLKEYLKRNSIKKIKLSLFGIDPKYYNIEYEDLPSEPTKGLIAISVNHLQGVFMFEYHDYSWLKKYKPVAKIGYSIFIYDIK